MTSGVLSVLLLSFTASLYVCLSLFQPSSGETREGWVKIDTIAADKSFSRVEPSLPHQYKSESARRINVKTRSFAPLTRKGYDDLLSVSPMVVTVCR